MNNFEFSDFEQFQPLKNSLEFDLFEENLYSATDNAPEFIKFDIDCFDPSTLISEPTKVS